MKPNFTALKRRLAAAGTLGSALLAACTSTPLGPSASPPGTAAVPSAPPAATASPEVVQSGATPITGVRTSSAANPRAYREDAATHLYGLNRDRIYKGRMPPLLYAIGVLQVEVDGGGAVRNLNWMRAPRHAPEVIKEIERTVRAAAPFPAPARMGKVVYTDTWLWHKSGRFQLDTLTEGQD
jgi:periplasmic protein TonB